THRFLLQEVWGSDYGSETNYVRVYVRHLRAKLDEPSTAPYILNQPGVGYLLRDGSLPTVRLGPGDRPAPSASARAGTALSAWGFQSSADRRCVCCTSRSSRRGRRVPLTFK